MILAFLLICILSVVIAALSMRDFVLPKEMKQHSDKKPLKGTIVIMKDTIKHYTSSSSSSSVSIGKS